MANNMDSLKIKFIPNGEMTQRQKNDVDIINKTCLSGDPDDPVRVEINMYDWSASDEGMFLLLDGERVVGRIAVQKAFTEYDGQEYVLGGFGGLAILPEYRGGGYARIMAELALDKAREVGVDVACMCVDMESGITNFYQSLGFTFLGRPAYFINWIDKEKTDNNVMIMGLNNKPLTEKILNTNHKFHYGEDRGHW